MAERVAAMSEKFFGFFRLVDACAKPGCPVCRCLELGVSGEADRRGEVAPFAVPDTFTCRADDLARLSREGNPRRRDRNQTPITEEEYLAWRALEMNLAGERGASRMWEQTVAQLREENERLRRDGGGVRGLPEPGRANGR